VATFTDDFLSYAPGDIPTQSGWASTGSVGTTAGEMVASGDPQVASFFKPNANGLAFFPYASQTSTTRNMRVLARINTSGHTQTYTKSMGVFVRGPTNPQPNPLVERIDAVLEGPRSGTRYFRVYEVIENVRSLLLEGTFQYADSTWYRIELITNGTDVSAFVFADLSEEPQVTLTGSSTLDEFGAGGYVLSTINAGGNGMTSSSFFADYDYVPPSDDPVAVVGSPTDRYRVNLGADSRSLLASASAVPFDASASVSLPPAVGSFYPRATQNDRQERTYDGITLLGRMQTAYPAPIFDAVVNLNGGAGLADNHADTIITYVLTQWATEFPWFGFETVPDLRTPMPGSTGVMVPGEYGASDGLITSDVVAIRQDESNRRSAYDILTDLLSPFPGTVFFQNAAGNLQIVPAYGPDADETPYKTLSTDDAVSQSLGEASIGTIVNRATVSSRGYQRSDTVAVMQPAWFQVGSNARLGTNTWYDPPANRANLQETTDGGILQEDLVSGQFGQQRPSVWPSSTSNIPAGNGIGLVDEYGDPLLTLGWAMYNTSGAVVESGTDGLTMIETAVPFDGVWRDTFRWDGPATAFETDAFLIMRARWNATAGGVELGFGAAKFETSCGLPVGCRTYVVEFTLDDLSVGYAETGGVTVTFGTLDGDETEIPNAAGTGNAVEDSQTAFGVLEERISVEGYLLDPEQALLMAQGYVLAAVACSARPTAARAYSSASSTPTTSLASRAASAPVSKRPSRACQGSSRRTPSGY